MEARRLEQEDEERWREERVQDRELEVEGKRSSEVLVGSCEEGVMVRKANERLPLSHFTCRRA